MLKNNRAKILNVSQGTDEWLDTRINKITSTLVGMIRSGATPSAIAVYRGETNFTGNIHTKRGNQVESELRSYFNTSLSQPMATPVVADGNLLASLDGILENGEQIFEFKSTSDLNHEFFVQDIMPINHMWQIQFCMGLTGASRCVYVMAYWDDILEQIDYNRIKQKIVYFDNKIWLEILAAIEVFYKQLDEMENNLDVFDDEHKFLANKYVELKAKEKALKNEISYIGDALKEYGIYDQNGVAVIERKGAVKIDYKNICESLLEYINIYFGNEKADEIKKEYNTLLADNTKEGKPTNMLKITLKG